MGRPIRAFVAALLAWAAIAAMWSTSASALSMSAPPDVLSTASVHASLNASDPAGLAMLVVDNVVLRALSVTPSSSVTFAAVPLPIGIHDVRLALRTDSGIVAGPSAHVRVWGRPMPAVLLSPSPNGWVGKNVGFTVRVGPATTQLTLKVNGRAVSSRSVSAGALVGMGTCTTGSGWNTVEVVAANPVATTTGTFHVRRLDYPWATCIIVDKSEFRLYWIRDDVLVKIYPVAIGKASTPTPARNWRVGMKYVYDYIDVYGPRRLRLYKQTGPNSFEYTNYGIHGTNQEWVIGTMASHGCIRMYNRDVLELYPQVPLGTMVQTRD